MSSVNEPIPIPLIPDQQVAESELRHIAFLSHEGTEKRTVLDLLHQKLRQQGISKEKVFYDDDMRRGGNVEDDQENRLKNGLLASEYIVVFLTPDFLRKRWPMWELKTFLKMMTQDQRRKLLPIFYRLSAEDCKGIAKQEISDELKKKLGSTAGTEEVRLVMGKVIQQFGIDAQGLRMSDGDVVNRVMADVFDTDVQYEDPKGKTDARMNKAKPKPQIKPGPIILERGGQETKFPTWGFLSKTIIWAESLEPGKVARVRIQAGAAPGRSFETPPGGKDYTSGKFAGLPVRVINENGTRMKVWTV